MKSLKMTLLLILVLIFPTIFFSNIANSLDDSNCKDYELVFARGSGQSLDDKDFRALKSAVIEKIPKSKIDFYEIGENGYKAVTIDFNVALGAYVSAGESYEFGESIKKGIRELISHINSEIKHCKNKKFILAGYSQGAIVVDKSLENINSEKIIYAGNFGDPKLYLPEGNRACKNIGLSNYRIYVPDCNVEEGVLGGLNPYQPKSYLNKLGVWCNKTDFMCGSSLNFFNIFGGHTSYDKNENGYKKFAEIIAEKIENKSPLETEARYSDAERREIILVFDHYQFFEPSVRIQYKTIEGDLKSVLVQLAEHGTRIAIYNSYGLSSPVKYLEGKIPFTNDGLGAKIDQLNRENILVGGWVFSGNFNNNFYAIKKLSENGKWSTGASRHIYLLTNTDHNTNISFDGTTVSDAITAAKKNHVYVSLLSNNGARYLTEYSELQSQTGGQLIARDYDKITLSQTKSKTKSRYFEKTFEINQDSVHTLVVINDQVYGLSQNKTITITNLNENLENTVRFISYNSEGEKLGQKTYIIKSKKVSTPDTGITN